MLLEIARLRAERAALLGFPNHAAFVHGGRDSQDPRGGGRDAGQARTPGRAQREGGAGRTCNVLTEDELDEDDSSRGAEAVKSWDWSF